MSRRLPPASPTAAPYPPHTWAILRRPDRIMSRVQLALDNGWIDQAPNAWQVCLGVLRMTQRMILRPDTVGTAPDLPVRDNPRAKLLSYRPLRLPFLLREQVIAPFDLTGMLSPPQRIRNHLIGAYHAGDEFYYDLQLLGLERGELEKLRLQVKALIDHDTPRHRWLRDLNAYEGYHETLLAAVEEALDRGVLIPRLDDDPDWSLVGYLRWCARQPATLRETIELHREGKFSLEYGRREDPSPDESVLREFLELDQAQLAQRLRDGHAIDPASIENRVYRGVSLGLHPMVDRFAWKTFQKAFARDPESGRLMGYNIRVEQSGYQAPMVPMLKDGKPFTFGHFEVVSCDGRKLPRGSDAGLLIDYSQPPKPFHDPMRYLRDPIVALRAGDSSQLLGWSYLQIGPKQVRTPSFFLLTDPQALV